jgi:hypothetical protein
MQGTSKTIYSDQSPCLDRRDPDIIQVSKCKTEASTSYSANMEQSRAPINRMLPSTTSFAPSCVCFLVFKLVICRSAIVAMLSILPPSTHILYPHLSASIPSVTSNHHAFAVSFSYPSSLLRICRASIEHTNLYDPVDDSRIDIRT